MTTLASQPDLAHALNGPVAREVSQFAQRQQRLDHLAAWLRGSAVFAAVLLGAIVFDAIVPLPPWLRLLVVVGLVLFPARQLARTRAGRATQQVYLCEAARIEAQAAITGNRLVNAVWLGGAVESDDRLAAALSRRCVEDGRDALARVDARQVLDRRALRRQMVPAIAMLTIWLALLFTLPRLIAGGVLRLLLPWGDHPPFSLTVFDVTTAPAGPIEFGRDATIVVALTGRIPQRVEVVELGEGGIEARRFPMQHQDDRDAASANGSVTKRVVVRHLKGLTESVTFRIEAETGHTRKHRIEVAPPPAESKQPPPAATDGASASTDPAHAAGAYTSALAEAAQRIRDKAAELSARLDGLPAGEPVPAWLREQVEELRKDIERFTGRAQSLEQLLQQLKQANQNASAQGLELQRVSAELAKKLAALKLPQVSLGLRGTPVRSPKQAGEQMRGAEKAAGDDLKNLQAGLADLEKLAGATTLGGSQVPVVLQPPDPRGSHTTDTKGGTTVTASEAVLRLAPQQYRELVSQYFQRLARDAEKKSP